jgi:hypothetical protein
MKSEGEQGKEASRVQQLLRETVAEWERVQSTESTSTSERTFQQRGEEVRPLPSFSLLHPLFLASQPPQAATSLLSPLFARPSSYS